MVEAEITVLEITAKNDPIRAFKAIYGFYFLVEAGVFATLISISGATLFKCPAEPKLPQSVLALGVAGLVLLILTFIKRFLLQRYDNFFTTFLAQIQCACGSVIFASSVAMTFFVATNLRADTDPLKALGGLYCDKTLLGSSVIGVILTLIIAIIAVVLFVLKVLQLRKEIGEDEDEENEEENL